MIQGNGWKGLQGNKTYKIEDEFTGNLGINGDVLLYVCGTANLGYLSISNNTKIIVFGELNATGISMNNSNIEIINYGKVSISGSITAKGTLKKLRRILL